MANYLSSTVQGAGTGAAAGGAIGGGWGALAGGVIGGLTGIFSAYEQEQDEEKKRKILQNAADEYGLSMSQIKQELAQWYKDNPSIGTSEDVETYKQLVSDYDPNEFVYDYEDFDNNYNVNDYYAPNRSAVIQATTDAAQATAAGSGVGRGTGAVNNIATAVADKSTELANNAQNAMNQDRQFAYQIWNANIQNGQNRLNQLKSAYSTQLDLYGNLASDYQNWNQQKQQTMTDLATQEANNKLTLSLAQI